MDSLFQIARVIRPEGSFGMLMYQWSPFAVSLERTFDDGAGGQRVVVPDGISRCVRSHYIKGNYDTYEIQVPGHDRVLWHILNVETQSEACIGVGKYFAVFNDPTAGLIGPGIGQSGASFADFIARAGNVDEFNLYVTTVKQEN